jgi:hypothetical protein
MTPWKPALFPHVRTGHRTAFADLEILLIGPTRLSLRYGTAAVQTHTHAVLTLIRVCCRLTRNLLPRNRDGVFGLRLLKILTGSNIS